MGSAKRVGNHTAGIVLCPNVAHRSGKLGAVTRAFRALTQSIVNLVSGYALEEELKVEAPPCQGTVETVGEPRERISKVLKVIIIDSAVTIEILVAGIAYIVFV